MDRRPSARRDSLSQVGLVFLLGGVALAVAVAAFPLARRVTRRLERLQGGVELLGAGDLSARVKVEGRDEVAQLAESFNRAAGRIEDLIGAHKMLLANASHELRTPLARIRLGVELLGEKADADRKAHLEADIAELDRLIEEILLASRLDAAAGVEDGEDVDLLALAAEEAARYENYEVSGVPIIIHGESSLLRRMVRNLLDNAAHHGIPPVRVTVVNQTNEAIISVCDQGDGIPETERESIFLPFYRATGTGAGTAGSGLGLSLVQQIARRHGGEVIYRVGAAGNCFVVTLPTQPATV
jgi:signal transduction histidine kinase